MVQSKKWNFWETPKTAGSPSFSRLSVRSFVLPWGTTVCVSHPWLVFCVNMYSEFMLLFVWLTVHLSARGDLREGLQTRAIVKKVLLWANASWGLRLWWFRLCLKQVCGWCSHDLDTLTYLSIMMESRKTCKQRGIGLQFQRECVMKAACMRKQQRWAYLATPEPLLKDAVTSPNRSLSLTRHRSY